MRLKYYCTHGGMRFKYKILSTGMRVSTYKLRQGHSLRVCCVPGGTEPCFVFVKTKNTTVAQWNTRFSRKWFYPFHGKKVTRHFRQMVVWSTQNAPRRQQFHVTVAPKPQALVYDILPSTTAVFSYAIGSRKLTQNVVLKLLCNILTVWACTLFWCRKFD